MPENRESDTATAVLPVVEPDDADTPLPTHHAENTPWRVRSALLEVSVQGVLGPPAQVRFPVRGGWLDTAGQSVTELQLHAHAPEHAGAAAYRALLGRRIDTDRRPTGLTLRCTTAPTRRRLTGALVVNGLSRNIVLRIKLLDQRAQRILLWLTGPVRLPVQERRAGYSIPRVLIAAEFIR